jgi:N4-gp56 family major capsid protein
MAGTSFPTNHPLAVKLWSKKLFVEGLKATYFGRFMGDSADNLCQVKPELNKSAGDKITFGLRMQLSGAGIQGDGTLEGNEEALTTYSDSILLDQIRHAVRSSGKMSEQRVPFEMREEARMGLQDWWADRLDQSMFNHLCGYSLETDTRYTGNNVTVKEDTAHRILGGTVNAGDEGSLSTTDVFSLSMIDAAVEKAKTATPVIRPIKEGGENFYVCFLHPYQVYNLRTNTNSGQWLDIQKAALTSGNRFADNPIFTGALGVYNNVILHESVRIRTGMSTANVTLPNVRRAVLCGAQALVFCYGRDSAKGEMTWVEELFDYGNQLGVSAGLQFGIKKVRFNNADFGTMLIPSYAVAHG